MDDEEITCEELRAKLEEKRGDPRFAQAVENVYQDLYSKEGNPHGNLKPELVKALDGCCDGDRELVEVIDEHCCHRFPALHCQSRAAADTVKRVMSLSDFIQYHRLGTGAANESEMGVYRRLYATVEAESISVVSMSGSTGPPERPCWWTFDEPEVSPPEDGKTLVEQLALSEEAKDLAKSDDRVITLELPSGEVEMFKPTSLEGFEEDTRFRPELTGSPFGRTQPARQGLDGRPELVSRSVRYQELREDLILELKVLPYEKARQSGDS